MKHFISVAVLVVLALAVRFWVFQRFEPAHATRLSVNRNCATPEDRRYCQ